MRLSGVHRIIRLTTCLDEFSVIAVVEPVDCDDELCMARGMKLNCHDNNFIVSNINSVQGHQAVVELENHSAADSLTVLRPGDDLYTLFTAERC